MYDELKRICMIKNPVNNMHVKRNLKHFIALDAIDCFKGNCIGYNTQNKHDQSRNIKSCEIPPIIFDTHTRLP